MHRGGAGATSRRDLCQGAQSSYVQGCQDYRARHPNSGRDPQRAIQRFWRDNNLGEGYGFKFHLFPTTIVAEGPSEAIEAEADAVSDGRWFIQCPSNNFATILLELAVDVTADDDEYTLNLPKPPYERVRTTRDPPREPLARHALTLRRAGRADLPVLTGYSNSPVRVSDAGLQYRCTDCSRYDWFGDDDDSEAGQNGAWRPLEYERPPSRRSREGPRTRRSTGTARRTRGGHGSASDAAPSAEA